MREFQLTCTIGIGPNMLMAKSTDLEAKKKELPYGAMKMFRETLACRSAQQNVGIGRRLERTLNNMGFFCWSARQL